MIMSREKLKKLGEKPASVPFCPPQVTMKSAGIEPETLQ
jgi:hypothetical protein